MLKNFFLVGMGGAIGSILRFGCGMLIQIKNFPLATLLVNIFGCLVIGILMGLSVKNEYRLLLATGLCGGFTTFSAFAFDNLQLIHQQKYLLAIAYTGGNLILGMIAVWIGFKLMNV